MKNNPDIQLASFDTCTGCAACASVCPKGCISMREDREGFLQPHIDAEICIDCHKCEKTCPIVTPKEIPADFETQAYAAINKNEDVRMRSSSGGLFHALAKWTIEQGGVVFGARFNEQWEVVHDYTETLEGIEPFMRSKYVQSYVGDTFKQAKQFLNQGRWVLYSGTPCQLGGLKSYLHKEYDNLIAVDFICHGVPSPKAWRKYWTDAVQGDTLLDFNFRDKKDGWTGLQCVTTTTTTTRERQDENPFIRGLLSNIFLRRSCYSCSTRIYHRISDITLGDFWGIENLHPDWNDNKGTSLILVHSTKGAEILSQVQSVAMCQVTKEELLQASTQILFKEKEIPSKRSIFFKRLRYMPWLSIADMMRNDSIYTRIVRKLNKFLNKCKK